MKVKEVIRCELLVESYEKVRFRRHESGYGQVTGILDLASISRQIGTFENLLRHKDILKGREHFARFGKLLYKCIFNGDVEIAFKQIIQDIERYKKKFRIQLSFSEVVSDLAGIPWEFLYHPDSESREGFFLVDYSNLVISRYISLETESHSLINTENELQFLIVASEPASEAKVLYKPVIEKILDLGKVYPAIRTEVLENPTSREVQDKINITKPHIFHFIGHGQFDWLNWQAPKGSIALVKSDKQSVHWISDSTFSDYFKDFRPSLVVLQTCQGGHVDFTANYAGLAPKLARKGIPAVIAMQYPITNKIASVFIHGFYKALAKGDPVDTAVQEGRKEIVYDSDDYYNDRDFATPVLYMSARDGNIMPRPKTIKFDANVLRSSPSELEKTMNILFNSEELEDLKDFICCLDINYPELNGETPQEKIKALIAQHQQSKNIERLVANIKEFKPDAFTPDNYFKLL